MGGSLTMSGDLWIPPSVAWPIWSLVCDVPGGPRAKRPVWMFQANFDDSGTSGPVFVLAGYLAPVERWALFWTEWEAERQRDRPIDFFKMQEAANFDGQFYGWSADERDHKVASLLPIIQRHAEIGYAVVVNREAFKQVFGRRYTDILRSPYVLAFSHLIIFVLRLRAEGKLTDPVDFVFDEQGKQLGQALEIWKFCTARMSPEMAAMIGTPPISRNDKKWPPLQAADFAAWQIRRQFDMPVPSRLASSVHLARDHGFEPKIMVEYLDRHYLESIRDGIDAKNLATLSADVRSTVEEILRLIDGSPQQP